MTSITFRPATIADAAAIAALHAASWRSAYRGSLPDAFLDGPIEAERAALWQARLAAFDAQQHFVLLAEAEESLVGFVCVLRDDEPAWGACLDNLHVQPGLTGGGIGRQLFDRAVAWLHATAPNTPLFLWVFEANIAARRFYDRCGGRVAERAVKPMPGGVAVPLLRYVWVGNVIR